MPHIVHVAFKKAIWLVLISELLLLVFAFFTFQMRDVIQFDRANLPFSEVSNMVNFILDLLILLSFFTTVGIAIIRRYVDGSNTGIEYLVVFDLLCAIYFFLESKFLSGSYYIEDVYRLGLFIILMTIPIALILYYDRQLGTSFRRLFDTLIIISFLAFFVQFGLLLSGLVEVEYLTLFTYMYIVICLGTFFTCSVIKEHMLEGVVTILEELGLLVAIICAFIDIGIGIINPNMLNGKYFRYGITVYCIVMDIVLLVNLVGSLVENSRVSSDMLLKQVEIMEVQNAKLREAKKEADEAKKQAQIANKAKSDFLARMSHEIRTPINAIIGMNTMIQRDTKDPEIQSYARDIEKASNSLYAIINDILDFSKIESGKMEILESTYNLKSVIHDCIGMVMMRAKSKRLNVVLKNDTAVPANLIGDAVRIRQIVNNILTNAIKYTDYGSVTMFVGYSPLEEPKISASDEVIGEKFGDEKVINLIIQITDTGQGMKKEDMASLFQTFQRINIERNSAVEGTGLGLSISKQLVDLMGGTIEVDSEYGVGSTFTVTIPQKVVGDEIIGDIASLNDEEEYDENKHIRFIVSDDVKILVVDDILSNFKVVEGLLKNTNIMIDYCDNGNTAIALTRKEIYDIIFLDHMMPGKDGVETFKEIKADKDNLNRETPIIMLTANAINGAKKEYLDIGFDDYLAKPIREYQLEAMIRKYISSDRIIDENIDDTWHESYKWYDKPKREAELNVILDNINLYNPNGSKDELHESDKLDRSDKTNASDELDKKSDSGVVTDRNENIINAKDDIENLIEENLLEVDEAIGMTYCGQIRELYDELIRDYIKENKLNDIRRFYEEEDFENYRISVHGLKSTSLTIGAKNFSEFCREIEQSLKAGSTDLAIQRNEKLLANYEKLLDKLGRR